MPKTQPTLQTGLLVLRPPAEAYLPDVHRLVSAWEIADTTLNIPHPYEDGMAEEWFKAQAERYENGEGIHFCIFLRDDQTFMGGVSLQLDARHQRGELGYWIGVPFWGHGYCTEAARVMVAYGFNTLDLNRIEAQHFTRNPASGRVMQKIGMRYEGCLRQHVRRWDKFEDLATYGILKQEFMESSEAG
ncbi:GNAT family N-acetyltransferase [Candidatus Entotheonella palauensis]|uniref:GNAT family N-acetyltransferase n=1 Tax=Candidatus Entotheonella palauensis TaxID=93172 RepID=UPI000B7DD207|nr:GNAT family N-acetyltransferase [Candidatus Entotheonella palauensis]